MIIEKTVNEVLTVFLARLQSDMTGKTEMEIRFGEIHRGDQTYFKTGVTKLWLLKVKNFLEDTGWAGGDEIGYKQYKIGQKRVRVFADGRIIAISKRVVKSKDIALHNAKDIRISLAREVKIEPPSLINKQYNRVYRQTYRQNDFKFDLTKTKHHQGGKWENRVELELINRQNWLEETSKKQQALKQIIEKVTAII